MSSTTLTLSPKPQESIISLIFRINMVFKPGKMPQLIDKKGRFSKYISLTPEFQAIFWEYTDAQIFSLLINASIIKRNQYDFLKSPVDYTVGIRDFLQGKRVKIGISSDVYYCASCIRESIEKYGFAYLKRIWTTYLSSDDCCVHKEPLYKIMSDNRKDTLQAIETVLGGRRSKFCKSLRDSSYYRPYREIEYAALPTTAGSIKELPHIAPCLEKRLKAWLLREGHTFPSSLIEDVRLADHDSLIRSMKSHVFRDFVFNKAYRALHESEYVDFHDFWERNSVIQSFFCGIIKKQGLQGKIAKLRSENCSKCLESFCPANQIILFPRCIFSNQFNSFDYKCVGKRVRVF